MKLNKHFYVGAVRVFFIAIAVAFTLSLGMLHPALAADPVLTITKSHEGNFDQGGMGTYTITVKNTSGAPVNSGTIITVVEELPVGLNVHSTLGVPDWSGTGWVCVVDNPDITCTRSDGLATGASFDPITLVVDVDEAAAVSEPGNILNNVAIVELAGIEQDRHTDPTTITQMPDLTVTKSDAGINFVQRGVGTYTITASNSGYAATTPGLEIKVTDVLPDKLTAKTISGTGWNCVLATLTCIRSNALENAWEWDPSPSHLPVPLPDITLTVDVAVDAPVSVVNTVTVSGGGEVNVSNNSGEDSTAITQVLDLVVAGVALNPASPTATDPFDVTVTVRNLGGVVTASNVEMFVYVDEPPVPDADGCVDDPAPLDDTYPYKTVNDQPIGVDGVAVDVVSVPALGAGVHKIYAYVDANCIVDESAENNNRSELVWVVTQMPEWTFVDVPNDYWAWRWIEGFYGRRITNGCAVTPLQYCPEREVTRAEMAVFILRAKYSGSYQPLLQSGTFADVPVSGKEWMMPWIEQFYDEGVTMGCSVAPRNYCPEREVTRAEMAVFLLRAKYGAGYQPPVSNLPIFADTPVTGKEWMQAWVEEFYRQGYTGGCSTVPLNYCPERNVTRAEMAVFISRVYNIPQLP